MCYNGIVCTFLQNLGACYTYRVWTNFTSFFRKCFLIAWEYDIRYSICVTSCMDYTCINKAWYPCPKQNDTYRFISLCIIIEDFTFYWYTDMYFYLYILEIKIELQMIQLFFFFHSLTCCMMSLSSVKLKCPSTNRVEKSPWRVWRRKCTKPRTRSLNFWESSRKRDG